jgi:hypothetical protein
LIRCRDTYISDKLTILERLLRLNESLLLLADWLLLLTERLLPLAERLLRLDEAMLAIVGQVLRAIGLRQSVLIIDITIRSILQDLRQDGKIMPYTCNLLSKHISVHERALSSMRLLFQ